MRIGAYFRLLRENRFQIHPQKYPMTVLVGICTIFNSILGAIQSLFLGKKIRESRLEKPPIFIIGHWRSGTTLMHELLALDERFAYPSNFDAFVPNHFLISRSFFYPIVKLLLPSKRPMDDMAIGAASPQEDDFALCAYGAPTPYRRIAFPNRSNRYHLQLNLSLSDAQERLKLQKALEHFLKSLTMRYQGKQLVLKSPPHTGRLKQLAQWFPQAKFVHMARQPEKIVPSTMRLWKLLDSLQGFQLPKYDDTWLKNYIFECKDLMYQAYFSQRDEIPQNQLAEINFEALVESPVDVMRAVYEQLELDGFDKVQPKIEAYFDERKNHQTNPTSIPDAMAEDISHHWREYNEAFGYADKA